MPEIKLTFGKMDLETDPSGKDEQVSAILYNAYRVGKNFHRTPGLTEFSDLETGVQVSVYYSKLHNVCLAVSGTGSISGYADLYVVNSSGVATLIPFASLAVNTPVIFTEDATRILFVANSFIHVYTVATDILTILGGQAPTSVTHITILRGFLLANGLDSNGGGLPGDFGWSNDPDYAVWQYENNAARPDKLQALLSTNNDDVFMIGSESIEVNYLSGDVSAPFAVNKPAAQGFGTPAPYTVAYDGQNIYMLVVVGGSRQVLRLNGGREAQLIGFPLSTPIDQIDDISDMQGFIVGIRGRTFYVLTCPSAAITVEEVVQNGITVAFDIRNEEWQVWGDWDSQNTQYTSYRGRSFSYAEAWDNKRLIGGDDGKIYLIDHSSYKFGDSVIRMALRLGWRSHGTMKWKTTLEYAYDFKAGVGNDDVASPSFIHRWRNDGNLTWNNPRTVKMGLAGNRNVPLKSRQCGRYHKRQDELVFSDAAEVVFNGLYEEVEVER